MVSSDTSLAPDSTIKTASSVPAMTSSSDDSTCSAVVGLAISLPSTMPTRTAPTGPPNGIPARQSAADAPFRASTSGSFSWSAETARQMTWISFLKPLGNNGRMGRSISREVRISFSTGRPSRLKYPPGIRPPAYARSPANPELLDDRPVPLGVLLAQVLDQTPPLADQHQQTASRMVVLGVLLEVLGQAVDPLGEKRDLHLGRPRVSIVDAILLDEGLLLFDGQRHGASNRHVPGSPRLHLNGFKTPCFAANYGAMVPPAPR